MRGGRQILRWLSLGKRRGGRNEEIKNNGGGGRRKLWDFLDGKERN